MSWYNQYVSVEEMINETFSSVTSDLESVTFENDKVRYVLYHDQDCCESVVVEEIVGDLTDLEKWPILVAREETNADGPELDEESYTWTFYNFATFKGYVTIRFLGTSNGYYSESVCCRKEIIQ